MEPRGCVLFIPVLVCGVNTPTSIIHRADYHAILLDMAISLGAEIRLNAVVEDVVLKSTQVVLVGGEKISGDVVIGADGSPFLPRL